MPELPEVETLRRMLERRVRGRTIRRLRLSGARLRAPVARALPRRIAGRQILSLGRHGKYLLIHLSGDVTLLSHLGMSGRWLYFRTPPEEMEHVHARFELEGGGELWYQDPRRFGLLRLARTGALERDPALAVLGPDPVLEPASVAALADKARGMRIGVKPFLLDQRRIAGIGNIYASEILHRAAVDPRRRAGAVTRAEWDAIARETGAVLGEAIDRMGTTFSMYRTLGNEPGEYGAQLRVYDRGGEPCRTCGTPIRRIVQGQRATFFCPTCQRRGPVRKVARAANPRARSSS
jgi:formamidopyrimidine-DNA glycosylase